MIINYSNNPKQKYLELHINGQNEQSEKLRLNIIPESLFRYQPASEERIKTLQNKKIYLSDPQKFDDPFDTNGLCWNKEDIFQAFKKVNPKLELKELDNFPEWILNEIKKDLLVVCFSEDLYNLPLWGSYAEKNTGFVIEYNFKKLNPDNILIKNLYPVLYSKYKFDFTKVLCELINLLYQTKNNPPDKYNPAAPILSYCLLIKHISWSYQNEWRLFNFENKNEYSDIVPTAIYSGLNSTPETKAKLEEVAKSLECDFFTTLLPKDHDKEFIYHYEKQSNI